MSSIKRFIKDVCVQDAVYWEYNGPDGFGSVEFADPTEIKVRWDDKVDVKSDSNGKEFVSKAEVLTPQDLKEQSYLYLGTLSELPANPAPGDVTDAYEIKAMDRYPLFKSKTLDVFLAYLTDGSR